MSLCEAGMEDGVDISCSRVKRSNGWWAAQCATAMNIRNVYVQTLLNSNLILELVLALNLQSTSLLKLIGGESF